VPESRRHFSRRVDKALNDPDLQRALTNAMTGLRAKREKAFEGFDFEQGRANLKQRRLARETLTQAIAIFDGIGAALWAARTRAELARVSGRAPGSSELTATELRVAELVAAGLTNSETASQLFVTVRAVESTLTKVYAKLGLRSRTELAEQLLRQR